MIPGYYPATIPDDRGWRELERITGRLAWAERVAAAAADRAATEADRAYARGMADCLALVKGAA